MLVQGLQEARIKAENYKKRQELKELERIIDENERREQERLEKGETEVKVEEKVNLSDIPWRSERKKEQMRWVGEEEHHISERKRGDEMSGWSWRSGVEDRRREDREEGRRRGPALDFKQEIKMPTVEVSTVAHAFCSPVIFC